MTSANDDETTNSNGHDGQGSPTNPPSAPRRLRYRLLTGPDDSSFCERVSKALNEGYELAGSPAITFDGAKAIVAQAVALPEAALPDDASLD